MKIKRNREAGQSLALVVVGMFVLISFLGLAIDIGYYRYLRRQLQTAADAAAIAGAMDITYGDVTTAARAASAENGFTTGSNGITVSVYCVAGCAAGQIPSGPFAGSTYKNDVQAVVTDTSVPTFFSKIFNATAPTLSASAVAEGGLNCIYGLDTSSSGAISMSFLDVVNSNCGVVDNSNLTGFLSALCAPSIQLLGSDSIFIGGTCSSGYKPAKPVKITSAVADPFCQSGLSCLPAPSPATLPTCSGAKGTYTVSNVGNGPTITSALTLGAGYCTGISISNSGTAAHPVTFNPGNYQGPIKITNSNVLFTGGNYAINSATKPGIQLASHTFFGSSQVSFQAGTYTVAGGIADNDLFGSFVNFNSSSGSPALFILDGGGLNLVGNSSSGGGSTAQSTGGVTFYNTGTASGNCVTCYGSVTSYFDFSASFCGSNCGMSAPISGTYTGILFFQDRSNPQAATFAGDINVNQGAVFQAGAYYFADAKVNFAFDFGYGAPYTYLVAKDIAWQVLVFTFNSNYASLPTASPLRQGSATLVQ